MYMCKIHYSARSTYTNIKLKKMSKNYPSKTILDFFIFWDFSSFYPCFSNFVICCMNVRHVLSLDIAENCSHVTSLDHLLLELYAPYRHHISTYQSLEEEKLGKNLESIKLVRFYHLYFNKITLKFTSTFNIIVNFDHFFNFLKIMTPVFIVLGSWRNLWDSSIVRQISE